MTSNQIAYAEMKEHERTNKAKEAETHRANRKDEKLKAATIREERRSNKASEHLRAKELHETKRSHKANERIGSKQARAAIRQAKNSNAQAKAARKNADTNAFKAATDYELGKANINLKADIAEKDRALNKELGILSNQTKLKQTHLQNRSNRYQTRIAGHEARKTERLKAQQNRKTEILKGKIDLHKINRKAQQDRITGRDQLKREVNASQIIANNSSGFKSRGEGMASYMDFISKAFKVAKNLK